MEELKPCPFCGGKAIIADEHQWIGGRSNGGFMKFIYCQSCGYRSERYFWDERKEMISDWNKTEKGDSLE